MSAIGGGGMGASDEPRTVWWMRALAYAPIMPTRPGAAPALLAAIVASNVFIVGLCGLLAWRRPVFYVKGSVFAFLALLGMIVLNHYVVNKKVREIAERTTPGHVVDGVAHYGDENAFVVLDTNSRSIWGGIPLGLRDALIWPWAIAANIFTFAMAFWLSFTASRRHARAQRMWSDDGDDGDDDK